MILLDGCFELLDLLIYFVPDLICFFPVETHRGGFLLNSSGSEQGRHRSGHSVEYRMFAFYFFNTLPMLGLFLCCFDIFVPINMRMAANQFLI